jgi:uncharacterized protein YjcR
MPTATITIRDNVQTRLTLMGVTLRDLAHQVGVSRTTIYKHISRAAWSDTSHLWLCTLLGVHSLREASNMDLARQAPPDQQWLSENAREVLDGIMSDGAP